jgi:DNA helicase HerA-like ATPase
MGQKGTGKTFSSVILSACIRKKVFYIDTVGVVSRLRLLKNAAYVKMAKVSKEELIKVFKQCYKKYNYTILDLSYFVQDELVNFMDTFCEWALKTGNMAVVIDEIGDYVPQYREVYSIELERLIRIGRNYNIQPVIMITQRPQKTNKEVLALADYYIIFRVMHNLDREKIKDLIGLKSDEWEKLEREIMKLPARTAYTFDKELNLKLIEFPILEVM